jgi:hypothetical protein
MSKVSITGNASGTGTFTIAAPNSNTDRTLTLPDEAGTVLTSGGAIDVDASAPADSVVIDSSGNLLVGKTAADNTTKGHLFNNNLGYASHVASGNTALYLNRLSSDGNVLQIQKDGTTVGSIGSYAGVVSYIVLDPRSGGVGLRGGSGNILPADQGGVLSDNAKDLGSTSGRWDDIYATNGTIQTSDRNEKQDIEELTEAEQRVAVACKSLLRKFRWKDAVAEKGDDARIHFGIIAQDLQAAFEAEGLDAGRYAMFISSTWWETQTEVPAVEADEENGIEAKEAYTRTDTYDTAEEAPEGATERTRLGVRYPELLAFIIAAI